MAMNNVFNHNKNGNSDATIIIDTFQNHFYKYVTFIHVFSNIIIGSPSVFRMSNSFLMCITLLVVVLIVIIVSNFTELGVIFVVLMVLAVFLLLALA